MKSKSIFWLSLCCVAWLTACGKSDEAVATPALMKINVVQAACGEWARTLNLSGNVTAQNNVEVGTSLQGLQVLAVKTDIGEQVKKGQVLALLEHSNLQSQLAQNEATLSRAKANLNAQEAAWREAESTFKRYQALVEVAAVSRLEFDQQRAKAEIAKAVVQSAKAEIAQLQAQLDDNRHQRSKAQVTAPVDGIITKRTVEAGSLTSGAAMFHIAKDGTVEVLAEVSRDELALIQVGFPVDIWLDGKTMVGGKIRLIPPEIDSTSRVAKIRIAPNDTLHTAIGSDVKVVVHLPKSEVSTSLPFSAVGFDADGKAFVKVVDTQGKVHKRAIEIGATYQSAVEILSGLQPNERVVERAEAFVDDGDVIEPKLVQGKAR